MSHLNLAKLFALSTLSTLLIACGGGSDGSPSNNGGSTNPPTTQTDLFTVKAKEWSFQGNTTEAQCYDIDLQQAVNCSGMDWDIKAVMNRGTPTFSSNGGASGNGKAAVLYSPFDATWNNLSKLIDANKQGNDAIPASAWSQDAYSNGFTATTGYSFLEYNLFGDHRMSPNFKIYFVTTDTKNLNTVGTEDKPVYAVQIYNYYNQSGTSGYISIRYIDTRYPDVVKTIENVDATNGWAYLDLKSGVATNSATQPWQLAFNRYNVQTNTGIGSTIGLQPTGFYDADSKPIINKFKSATVFVDTLAELKAVATTVKQVNSWTNNGVKSLLNPAYKGAYGREPLNYGWFTYYSSDSLAAPVGLKAHMLKANPEAASLIRGNTGNSYARLHLKDVKYADPSNASSATTWTFELDIQPAK
ncbi:HmuY family protein [Acinetobacter sp. C26M]|uniref:HmuY family protein n=1 Tax=unclassified Acinetobacter TaxID=196816 RepID=UPI0020366840|nr:MULTISPECIES: HmuY family protein [unclassified Acinetobacter]USA45891.1 HmuY family protein [Acinetobacter sp. C26M]USA49374.1 HmuY family protein [Acinetobacter sp. C26G]